MTSRRAFLAGLAGLGAALAAPSIVRAESLMKIAQLRAPMEVLDLGNGAGLEFSTDHLLVKGYERYAVSYADWRILNDPVFVAGMKSLAKSLETNIFHAL